MGIAVIGTTSGNYMYDVSSDGQRFLVVAAREQSSTPLALENGEGIEVLQLPSDFYTADAGEAGQELLSRVQGVISARGSRCLSDTITPALGAGIEL